MPDIKTDIKPDGRLDRTPVSALLGRARKTRGR